MLSLLDLYNMREGKQPGSDLLEFYQGNGQAPEPQVIDRATFLPIGQYEDGPAFAELIPSEPPPYRLPGDVGQSSELRKLLEDNHMLGNPFGGLPPVLPPRMWPEKTPEDVFWEKFHNDTRT